MTGRVFVTGIGVISAIGNNVKENLDSLRNQKSGIGKIEILDTIHKDEFIAGEIKYTNNQLSDLADISEGDNLPRTSLLALIAAKESILNSGIDLSDNVCTGLIGGTTVGGMEKTEKYYYHPELNTDFIKSHSCGSITEQVAEYIGITDFVSTINTACSSSANAILHGARLINHGYVDRVIAGGFDALSKFTLNGFKSLFILSPELCTPFDKNRKGLNLGEGAGFIVLESEELLMKSGKKPLCRLSGSANANDAFHQTASSPNGEGAYRSMAKALKMAGINADQIDYINLHGTGTDNNDFSEAMALKHIFGNRIPHFSSTKPYVGHTLGAAGGIEAVFSILSITEKLIFPNLFFKDPIPEFGISPVQNVITNVDVKNVMSNSFGFGGNDTSLIFSSN